MKRTLNTRMRNRPTNATDSVSLVREWLYNRRLELAAANGGVELVRRDDPIAPQGDTTTWTYDPRTSLCTSKTYADNSTVTYAYTPDNLPLRTTYASGRWKENVYDAQRRLCGVIYSSSNMDYELQLDEYGRTTFASNGVAQTCYVLNDAGGATNETRATDNAIDTITRTFDGAERLTGLAITEQGYAQYLDYSTNGLLTSISNSDAVVAYNYSPDLKDVGYTMAFAGGGTFVSVAVRDPYRRDLVLSVANSCGGNTHTLEYSYDALSRPISRNADTFGYNDRSEVSSANIGGNSETHEYDDIGNATFAAFNFATNIYTANNLNQYTSILCDSATLREPAHDVDGNLTFDGVFSYAYDADNRLASVSSNELVLVTNQYDHKGRRVRKTTPTSETTFLYDGWNLIYEREIAGTVTNETYYYWGKDVSGSLQGAGGVGGLLYLKRNGTIYIPHRDANGNIVRYTDTVGDVVAEYTYGAFGNTLSATGTFADVFHFRYSTKYYDPETGLYYYGYRFYSPVLMRWLNRDPIEEDGGCNLYAFCKNAPLLYIDVQGEHPAILIPLGIAARAAFEAAVKAAIAAALALAAKDLLKSKCKSCRPCDPLVGTIGYRVDFVPPSKPHFPFKGTHTHLSVVMQSPPDMCRCFWHKIDIRDGVDIPPDAVPMNGPPGGGGVYYY